MTFLKAWSAMLYPLRKPLVMAGSLATDPAIL
jgi:hypothetical protein